MKKTKLILDCDNTMGLDNRDIDDGMALMYLLGRDDVELLGITLTAGNGTIDEVEQNHKNFSEIFRFNVSLHLFILNTLMFLEKPS